MKTWLRATAFLLLSAHQSAATPASEEHALLIMSQAKTAAGGARLERAKTFYNSGTRIRDGKKKGVYQEWGDYRTMAFVNTETFDGIASTGGYDGKRAWQVQANGTVMVLADTRQAAGTKLSGYLDVEGYFFPDRFPAKFDYVETKNIEGRLCDVIHVVPDAITPIDLCFDQKTHLLRQLNGQLGSVKVQGSMMTYQTVNAIPVMKTALQTASTPSGPHTESQNVVVYRFEPLPPERLAIPK